ncbi:MAG: hypothetical protein LBN02_01750 [Oscillospiraceae bacterium]|jgi:hypothetical protein|nr:hypothetical protein [Oscillospiraceae bacterium]
MIVDTRNAPADGVYCIFCKHLGKRGWNDPDIFGCAHPQKIWLMQKLLPEISSCRLFTPSETPAVEGTTSDTGFKGTDFCDEYCPFCESEAFNIPTDRVSLCPNCGAELFPCSACDDRDRGGCSWSEIDMRCRHFSHTEEFKARHTSEE